MKRYLPLILSALFLLSACSSHQKKILIYANSNIQVDESQKNITVTEGNSQVEKELNFTGADPVILNITGPKMHYTLEAKEDGLWLANLKFDTIVGSMQHIGEIKQTRITQEQLKLQLDSLNKLVKGLNISAGSKNYFILPGKMEKITDLTNAKIFPPFTPIPSGFDASSAPEIYKFYNLSEENEIISKLTEMSRYKYQQESENDDSVRTIHPTKK
jgi:hypothetical protein